MAGSRSEPSSSSGSPSRCCPRSSPARSPPRIRTPGCPTPRGSRSRSSWSSSWSASTSIRRFATSTWSPTERLRVRRGILSRSEQTARFDRIQNVSIDAEPDGPAAEGGGRELRHRGHGRAVERFHLPGDLRPPVSWCGSWPRTRSTRAPSPPSDSSREKFTSPNRGTYRRGALLPKGGMPPQPCPGGARPSLSPGAPVMASLAALPRPPRSRPHARAGAAAPSRSPRGPACRDRRAPRPRRRWCWSRRSSTAPPSRRRASSPGPTGSRPSWTWRAWARRAATAI